MKPKSTQEFLRHLRIFCARHGFHIDQSSSSTHCNRLVIYVGSREKKRALATLVFRNDKKEICQFLARKILTKLSNAEVTEISNELVEILKKFFS